MAKLAAVKSLRELNLSDGRFTDKGLAQLATLPNLERLAVTRVRLTEKGIESLAGIRTLQALTLDYVPVTDKALESLKALPATQAAQPGQHQYHRPRRGNPAVDPDLAVARSLPHGGIEEGVRSAARLLAAMPDLLRRAVGVPESKPSHP